MSWPYHLVSLSSDQKHERRALLARYGSYAQLSALIPILGYQLFLLGRWVYLRATRPGTAYSAVSQPSDHRRSQLGRRPFYAVLRTWRIAAWWLNDELGPGWGLRQHWIAGAIWSIWMLFLCVHRTGDDYLHVTKRLGIVAAAQFPLHYMLAMKSRYSPLVFLFRTSHERLNPWHRLSGRVISLLLALHAAGYINYYIQSDKLAKLRSRASVTGLIAIALLTLLTATTLDRVRNRTYRVFFTSHLAAAILLPPILFFHVEHLRIYILETLLVYAFDRVTRRLSTVSVPAHITRIPRTNLLRLHLALPADKLRLYRAAPAQHVNLSLPAETAPSLLHRYICNPFSVADVPNNGLTLVVRPRGGPMTRALDARAESSPANVSIEGPLGATRWFPDLSSKFDRVLIVAGGVGGTFAVPVYRELRAQLESELKGAERVSLVWAVKSIDEVRWAVRGGDEGWLQDENVRVYVTGSERWRDGDDGVEMSEMCGSIPVGTRGRPNLTAVVDATFSYGDGDRVAVLFCGPQGMARDLRACVRRWAGRDIWWYEERFGW
ncbi:hypothetical protein BDV59DRAFT_166722 [Aspergillus ambiguus]|uniref:putative metalloreductase Fre8 n=1 Tax=Aspergillus ambiguus TaxID=176160 RepID=UPI003CCDFB5F